MFPNAFEASDEGKLHSSQDVYAYCHILCLNRCHLVRSLFLQVRTFYVNESHQLSIFCNHLHGTKLHKHRL
jgi:hypothetical protein